MPVLLEVHTAGITRVVASSNVTRISYWLVCSASTTAAPVITALTGYTVASSTVMVFFSSNMAAEW
ncbi:hypothetical protein D3C84_1164950 [compost metagenome]